MSEFDKILSELYSRTVHSFYKLDGITDNFLEDELNGSDPTGDKIVVLTEEQYLQRLRNMEQVLNLLGNPQNDFKVVHIAGTNGKTSTTMLTASLIKSFGLRCGTFTSPHLKSVCERIEIDGEPIAEIDFIDVYHQIMTAINEFEEQLDFDDSPLSFFEVLTIMMFQYFSNQMVHFAVIETGLGGRYDATNLVKPEVEIITPIAYDHMAILGNNLEEIAMHKAGIIKPGTQVVIADNDKPEITALLTSEAEEIGAKPIVENRNIFVQESEMAVGGQAVTFETTRGVYQEIPLSLFGEHQAHNALVSLAAVEELFSETDVIDEGVVRDAFLGVKVPGRFEQLKKDNLDDITVIVDVAHNPQGAEVLAKTISSRDDFDFTIGVIAMSEDKDVDTYIANIQDSFDYVIATQYNMDRSMSADDLEEVLLDYFETDRVQVVDSVSLALERAKQLGSDYKTKFKDKNPVVIVTGSVYTVGEIY
ncbi:MAG: bifunctional folylpolyglutamate synthase/dihydrofolate synthase [Candidatus Ancillula sp.]|jgi:dihydrofolate synthase/folylpolyglutamate synthase|nr:bifunctional folylpolyglutamate synthase/dihydrofolate synthase [Candidatus Ancillula sp.]